MIIHVPTEDERPQRLGTGYRSMVFEEPMIIDVPTRNVLFESFLNDAIRVNQARVWLEIDDANLR